MKKDFLAKISLLVAASSLLSLTGIVIFLFKEGLPAFAFNSPLEFLFGLLWYPANNPPVFGILSFMVASLLVTLLASCIAVPLGIMTALFLNELAAGRLRRILKPIIELLAALPSVVIGFFGMVIVAPFLEYFLGISIGLNLFNAALMLAFMSIPTICSVAEDALSSVSRELREASLALGATKWETMFKVVFPAAKSGVGTAIMLGMSRSIGETMVVLMVAGGAGALPESLFDPIRPMTSVIAAEMAESPVGSPHYHALFAIAIVLFLFTFCFNLIAQKISQNKNNSAEKGILDFLKFKKITTSSHQDNAQKMNRVGDEKEAPARLNLPSNIKKRKIIQSTAFSFLHGAAFLNVLALFGVCGFLLWQGLPAISWEFLTEFPQRMMTKGGILPCIVGTVLLASGALLVAFPFGVLSAIYLHEYAGRTRFSLYIRLGVNNLAGVPSIVFGLFGFTFFVIFCGLGVSLISGILTLAILTLPVVIGTAEESLRQVPDALRESSMALGATKAETITRVVLPMAFPGMLTGAILGLGRAAGETAAIMFTAAVFLTPKMPDSIFSPVMALPNHIYTLATSGTDIDLTRPLQYGTAVVLILLVLGMNMTAIIMRDKMQRKMKV